MFCACVSIICLFCLMIVCAVLSLYNLQRYNFGLYYVLLCVVGIMISCAFCIAKPNACPNPAWYNRFTLMISTWKSEKRLRRDEKEGRGLTSAPIRREAAATFMMLAPAMQLMHNVWKGMAWVSEEFQIEELSSLSNNGLEATYLPRPSSRTLSAIAEVSNCESSLSQASDWVPSSSNSKRRRSTSIGDRSSRRSTRSSRGSLSRKTSEDIPESSTSAGMADLSVVMSNSPSNCSLKEPISAEPYGRLPTFDFGTCFEEEETVTKHRCDSLDRNEVGENTPLIVSRTNSTSNPAIVITINEESDVITETWNV